MTAPWAAVELDPDRVVAELTHRFPGVSAWLGEFTGRWWAVARDQVGRDRLLEAPTPAALARLLDEIGARQQTRPYTPRYARTRQSGAPVQVAPSPSRTVRAAAPRRDETTRHEMARHERPRRGGWFRSMVGALIAT